MVSTLNANELLPILEGQSAVKLSSLALQLKINALKNAIKNQKMSALQAAYELAAYCEANAKMLQADSKKLFKNI